MNRPNRPLVVVVSAIMAACLIAAPADAEAPPSERVSLSVPGLFPGFRPTIRDYVVRCHDQPVTVDVHVSGGWQAAIDSGPFRSGNFSQTVPLSSGRAFRITFTESGHPELYRYYVRCLSDSFPAYTYTRYGPVSPQYFTATRTDQRYAMIFNNYGVPIWWIHGLAGNARVLPSGNVIWFDHLFHRWEIHRLDGSLIRVLGPPGELLDHHGLQFLYGGDYLVGEKVEQGPVDTTAYGGPSDATIFNAELQQVSPDREPVWDWKNQDHISLDETGRWWPYAIDHDYDVAHWNSIEPAGGSVIASFRHLDAVYKIKKSTGE